MSLIQTIDQVDYPESDGKPMGETDVHIDWMIRIRDILRHRYRGQQVYVGANLLVYYQEGDPSKFVVPDDFVAKDCQPGRRRTFKIWEEGKAPDVAFEITSRSSRQEDESYKPQVYARVGVREYFLYDPTGEYLDPPLQGFRLHGLDYRRIKLDRTGAIKSDQLGIALRLKDGDLVFSDARTGDELLTKAEAAEGRAAQLEDEVKRLRAELDRKSRRS
jgi:Uma2 family endonuclease